MEKFIEKVYKEETDKVNTFDEANLVQQTSFSKNRNNIALD